MAVAQSIAGVSNSSLLSNYVSSTATSSSSSTSSSQLPNISSSLNIDFSTYISILTTQLKNQDPTDAADPNQFTQELVQLGGVEQQINTNTDLTALLAQGTSTSLATGAGYIGKYVAATSSSDAISLQNSSSEFGYTLASQAASTTVSIQDSNGDTVASFQGGTASGVNYVTWNGLDNNGTQMPDGSYTYSVAATDASKNVIAASSPVVLAQVTGVQSNTDGSLELICGDLSVSSTNVDALYTSSSLPNSTALTTSTSASTSNTSS